MEEIERQSSLIEYLLQEGHDKSSREASKKGFMAEQGNF